MLLGVSAWVFNYVRQLFSARVIGNVVLQLPIGWLADRFQKRKRTLIVADEGSYVSYLEGCTAPQRDK